MAYNPNAAASGIVRVGTYDPGVGEGGSEVVAFEDGRLYVTNGALARIDVVDAATLTLVGSLDLTNLPNFGAVTSVAVRTGRIAVAIDATDIEDIAGPPAPRAGMVAVFDAAALAAPPELFETGNHPDMVTFSADGGQIFVAIEAEKNPDYAEQPRGGLTVVDLDAGVAATYDFQAFDGREDALRALGVRIFPGASASRDFEPEYIAQSPDGTKLFVTLQEANAVAVFDLATRAFTAIQPLGLSDHAQPGAGLDPSDRDDAIAIARWPVFGMRMPDAIAAFEIDGSTYYATVNEGDDRGESARLANAVVDGLVTLDPTAFPAADAAALLEDAALGRLTISLIDGDADGDGDIDRIHSYGGRSFSIYAEDGAEVYDSGDLFETAIAALRVPGAFNNEDFRPGLGLDDEVDDNRSDNKGPEPEALAIGEFDGALYAFAGMESDSGVFVFRIEDPTKPELAGYIEGVAVGDVGPETIRFIPAAESATGNAQLTVAYEVSGTTTLIDLAAPRFALATAATPDLTGSLGEDTLVGNSRANLLEGGGASDRIFGRGGADVIVGGLGDDGLMGGGGADRFVFAELDGSDRIRAFQEIDVLDLRATGAGFEDLSITEAACNRTIVRLGDDLAIDIRHGAHVTIDASDFLF